jgi:hypothetical protein
VAAAVGMLLDVGDADAAASDQQRLEEELAAAYAADAELDREICREFDHVDGDALRSVPLRAGSGELP